MMPLKESRKKFLLIILFLFLLIGGTFMISLGTGHLPIPPSEVADTLMGRGSERNTLVLFEFRLPRLVIALLIGAGLSVSGAILQSVTQNSLAEPGILGINTGAGFAVVLFFYFSQRTMSALGTLSVYALPFAAFAGALLAALLIYVLAWKQGVHSTRLILVGIGVNAGFGAGLTIFQLRMDASDFNRAAIWLSGSIWNAHWTAVWSILPWVSILVPLALYKARTLNILNLGDEVAASLGTAVEKERGSLLVIGVALAGACVSVGGGIAFLGLGAPHIARKLVGGNHQRLLPVASLIGSWLLLLSDIFARNVLASSEIPVGLVVSVLGAPYFIYLLLTAEN